MDKEYQSSLEFQMTMTRTPYTIPVSYERYKRDASGKILTNKKGEKLKETVTTEIHAQSRDVFFFANIYELFGVSLNYKGMKSAVNKAYLAAKAKTPYATGYSRGFFKMQQIDSHTVKLFYDRNGFIGGMRLGKKVKDFYPLYWFEMAKPGLYNFLDILIKTFYDTLYTEVRKLYEKNDSIYGPDVYMKQPTFMGFETFIEEFNKQYYSKREKAKQEMLAKDEAKKKLAEKVKELKATIKLRQDEKSKIILKRIEEAK